MRGFAWVLGVILAVGCGSGSGSPSIAPSTSTTAATTTASAPSATPDGQVEVRGRVTHEGEPAGRTVLVFASEADGLVPEGLGPQIADDQGRFRVTLAPGRYIVRAVGALGCPCQPGCRSQSALDVRADAPEVELALAPDERAATEWFEKGGSR